MKYLAINTLALLFCLFSGGLSAQTTNNNSTNVGNPRVPTVNSGDIYKDRDKAEQKTGGFNVSYFSNPDNRHYLLRMEVTANGLQPVSVLRAVGKMPHVDRSGGGVQIRVLDKAGRAVDTYYVEDPTLLRSCDLKEVGTRLPVGQTVDIPLPNNGDISQVEINGADRGNEKMTLQIGDMLKRAGQ